jgi:hypothetical protein
MDDKVRIRIIGVLLSMLTGGSDWSVVTWCEHCNGPWIFCQHASAYAYSVRGLEVMIVYKS